MFGSMLDSLVLLLRKVFVLARLDLCSLSAASKSDKPRRLELGGRLERGDLLEVPRTLFVHFGIYLGDGKVAHLMPDVLPLLSRDARRIRAVVSNRRLLLGVLARRASVRVDSLEDFVYNARVLLINTMDGALGQRAADNEEVARRAEKLVGPISYSLLWNNCEHFVTQCRYGTAVSLQTDKFCKWLKSVVQDPRTLLVTTAAGTCSVFSCFFIALSADEEKKKPKRYDVSAFKRGDLLEVPRTLFTHFGIYLGDGRVAHLIPDILPIISGDRVAISKMVTNVRLILGVIAKKASVRVDSVADFAYGADVFVNTVDKVCSRPPLGAEEVAERAEKLVGPVDYSLLWFNCEHYVMYCRYGASMSFQTYQFCKRVRKIILSKTTSFLSLLLCAFITFYLGCLLGLLPTMIVSFTIWMAS